MNRADGSPTLDALRDLLTESFRHWGCDHGAVAVGSAPSADEDGLIEFSRDGAAWISVSRSPADGPVRWLVESAQPDPLTARTRFPCTSVLHVLRTVRQLADPEFEPGSRIRMGAPGWAA